MTGKHCTSELSSSQPLSSNFWDSLVMFPWWLWSKPPGWLPPLFTRGWLTAEPGDQSTMAQSQTFKPSAGFLSVSSSVTGPTCMSSRFLRRVLSPLLGHSDKDRPVHTQHRLRRLDHPFLSYASPIRKSYHISPRVTLKIKWPMLVVLRFFSI